MEKNKTDHIALTLVGHEISSSSSSRKSLRRSWNQLPRCQRNLIIVGVMALFATLLLLLPGDQLILDRNKLLSDRGLTDAAAALPMNSNDVGADINSYQFKREVAEDDGRTLNEIAHLKKKLQHGPPLPQSSENNLNNEPDFQKPANLDVAQIEHKDKNPINEVQIVDNHLEQPAMQSQVTTNDKQMTDVQVRAGIEAAIQEPFRLPGTNGVSIEEFVSQLGSASNAQKQHFHGATNERQSAVVAAFQHSWKGYKKYAWGHDNLRPLSQTSHDWFGLGLTLVDALDTLYIMGLDDEFQEARDWVKESLKFDINRDVNLFEVTIRVLGGLLSTYHLSGDTMFLEKAIELGNRLLPCFLSPSGIPYSDANLSSLSAHSPKWSPDSSTSEVTTIQLEFRDLSRSTHVPLYEKVIQIVNEKVHALDKNNGLVPIFINANTGTFRNYATVSLGARGDSYYEYLLKQWIQTGRKENDPLILDYLRAIDGVLTQLMRRTPREQHVYIGELINGKEFKPKMDHLTCYLPGTLLLGHKHGMPDSHLLLARDLLETCYQTYMKNPTQLGAEITYFALTENEEHDLYVKPNDAHNLLRPEFIESLYYFYVLTGNRTYQDMGWNIFQAFEKHTKVASGYSSIGNVKNILNTRLRDLMESFWLGETLKYFYLLFSDNVKEIDLDKWIFNTEAHPLPIQTF